MSNKCILELSGQKQTGTSSLSSSDQSFFKLVWLSNYFFPLLWGSSGFCLPWFPAFQLDRLRGQKKAKSYCNRYISRTISWQSVGSPTYSHEEPELSPGLSVKPGLSIHPHHLQKGTCNVIFSCSDLLLYSEFYLVRQGWIKIPA